MRIRSLTALLVAVVTALALTACGDGDGGGGEAATGAADDGGGPTVIATEYDFDPAELSIPADTAVEVTLDNQGIIEHDWTIDELDVQLYADAGESTTGSVTAPAGTYEVYCSIPGHRQLGMEGVLTVG
jgi:uncharacterized cupredoxin-like copper-binding protein